MMKTTAEKQHTWLVKRFHTFCTRLGLEAYEKAAILEGYGVASSLDLSNSDLQRVCADLERQLNPELVELDKWRKRLMAAIGGWLSLLNKEANANVIRAIACRASGYGQYNDIPKERLINLYYAFVKKQKDYQAVEMLANEEIELLTYCN